MHVYDTTHEHVSQHLALSFSGVGIYMYGRYSNHYYYLHSQIMVKDNINDIASSYNQCTV